jgi:hypothetical protein
VSTFEDAIEIDAPAERTFELVADPRHLSLIDPTASVRLLAGDWTTIGSRHHVTNRYGRSLIDSVHEITRFEPPCLVEKRITSRGTVMVARSEVRPIGTDRSVLIVRGRIEWGGSFLDLVSRLLFPLTGPPSRRKALRRIKTAIESVDVGELARYQPPPA